MLASKLIVGLGNPGPSYYSTRHNAGALQVENFAQTYHFPKFQLEKKFSALLSRGEWQQQKLILALPQTFMNLSGESVVKLVQFYKLHPPSALLVIYDDLDLPFGSFKATQTSPHGHNGILSLKQHLGDLSCHQIRLGIDDRQGSRQIPPADYVLQNFSLSQKTTLVNDVFPLVNESIKSWLSQK